ncbi:MAG: Recombination protein [Pseudomonadota bacterium]|jgi:DNA repair protein RecO (recombination protein O)
MATSKTWAQAYLLHSTPYRETSLIVDLFTREHGRIAAVAKGARRKGSAMRAVLMPFQPLSVAWVGARELRTLTQAEWQGGSIPPCGDALLCAFYLNELLMRLLAREDPHEPLFDAYAETLRQLDGDAAIDEVLRRFEWTLLRETGHAPTLVSDSRGRAISAETPYQWQPEAGFSVAEPGAQAVVDGATLLELADGRFSSPQHRLQAKYLVRAILSHQLDGQALRTRQILIDLHKL